MHTYNQRRDDRGFTLVELLIVIVILGVLATITVFAVRGITDRGEESACATDWKNLETAQEANMANTGDYVAEAQLVSNGLLRSESSLVDVTLSGGNYTLTYVGSCAGAPTTLGGGGPTAIAGFDVAATWGRSRRSDSAPLATVLATSVLDVAWAIALNVGYEIGGLTGGVVRTDLHRAVGCRADPRRDAHRIGPRHRPGQVASTRSSTHTAVGRRARPSPHVAIGTTRAGPCHAHDRRNAVHGHGSQWGCRVSMG